MITSYIFDDSRDAYDAANCRDEIRVGAVLIIPSEGIVAMSDAWPVAITLATGGLHSATEARYITDSRDGKGMGATMGQLIEAIDVARSLGFPVDPIYLAYAGEPE